MRILIQLLQTEVLKHSFWVSENSLANMTPRNLQKASFVQFGEKNSQVLRSVETLTELTIFCMSNHRLLPSMANMVTVVVSIYKSLSRTSLLQRILIGQAGKVFAGDPAINPADGLNIIAILP